MSPRTPTRVANLRLRLPIKAVYDPHHIFPGKQLLWFNSAMVREIIESMKLVPVELVATPETEVRVRVPNEISAMGVGPWNGGMKALHLHFEDKLYLIDEKQWAEISVRILADVKAKLANVKEVGFEEGVLLGSMFG